MESSDKWQFLIDKRLNDALDAGKLSNLPGEGKPLRLEDDSYTPPHLRLAHKVLRDHGFVPDWIVMGKELDQRHERLLKNVQQAVRNHQGVLQDAERSPMEAQRRRQNAHNAWLLTVQKLEQVTQKLNREIMNYNLKVPAGVEHKKLFQLERELENLLPSNPK